ncbi:hypothetical protein BDZ89DRAFT_1139827 [Hymenopellis radicata]|nr:hypothetical protein BDZ89DRAFT_1139827 [Hymenopellis radicata]
MADKTDRDKVPCDCYRCNGALVHWQTQHQHSKETARDVPSFSSWQGQSAAKPPPRKRARITGQDGDDMESMAPMDISDHDDTSHSRSVPRMRTPTPPHSPDIIPMQNNQDNFFHNENRDDPESEDDETEAMLAREAAEAEAVLARQMADNVRAAQEAHAALEAERRLEAEHARAAAERAGDDEQEEHANETLSNIETVQFTQHLTIDPLRNPPQTLPDLSNEDVRYSIDLFLAMTHASDDTFTKVRDAALRRHPDDAIMSHYEIKKLVEGLTGVVSVDDDMCINSCLSYVGPFEKDEKCRKCGEDRYDQGFLTTQGKKVAREKHSTILLGPILQAIRRSNTGADALRYLERKMKSVSDLMASLAPELNGADMVYDDVLAGSEFWDLVEKCDLRAAPITGDDTLVGMSIDGLQLYQNKKSDMWLGIWVVYSFDPIIRYKQIEHATSFGQRR